MEMPIRVYPISEFRNSIKERLVEARESQDPLYIAHHGKPQAVVLDIDTWERLVMELNGFRSVVVELEELSQRL
jgi:prevent-host-death family protein